MLQALDTEVLLAGGYAAFLMLFAFSLELVARYSHRRSEQLRVAGFRYHRQHDIWECPTGQRLTPVASDFARRLVRYRAPAHACNVCSLKQVCTESDMGREIEHNHDSWRSPNLHASTEESP